MCFKTSTPIFAGFGIIISTGLIIAVNIVNFLRGEISAIAIFAGVASLFALAMFIIERLYGAYIFGEKEIIATSGIIIKKIPYCEIKSVSIGNVAKRYEGDVLLDVGKKHSITITVIDKNGFLLELNNRISNLNINCDEGSGSSCANCDLSQGCQKALQ
ncbi:MAG: hypothetical protein FWE33_04375 [Defluviitaleaceae bacterium]|nr:hypothetical protein [Defluviitaleaceae bacterium]